MQISLQWLKDYISIQQNPQKIAELLTESGLEVSKIETRKKNTIFSIDTTPNRVDAFSHIGIARDLSALYNLDLKYPAVEPFPEKYSSDEITIKLEDQDCIRYSGLLFEDVKIEPSPEWLQKYLESIQVSSINNIVDITNFVLHELGQPLHAFDYDQILEKTLYVKPFLKGTSFKTLDTIERKATGDEIMIGDKENVLAIGGVLGAQKAAIGKHTRKVFIESACFRLSRIRKVLKQHKIATEASFRTERGTDPNRTLSALQRAYYLIKTIMPQVKMRQVIDIYPRSILPAKVSLSYQKIYQMVGQTIPKEKIQNILQRLEIEVQHQNQNRFIAIVPTYRADVYRSADVIEEIMRIYGYNKLALKQDMYYKLPLYFEEDTLKKEQNIKQFLKDKGYYEILTNTLVKPEADQKIQQENQSAIKIQQSNQVVRTQLVYSGIEVIHHNLNRKAEHLKLFELSNVTYQAKDQFITEKHFGIWLAGNNYPSHWNKKFQKVNLYELIEIVDLVLHTLGVDEVIKGEIEHKIYTTGLKITKQNQLLAELGELKTSLWNELEIKQPIFYANIYWNACTQFKKKKPIYEPIIRHPEVRRNLSLIVDTEVNYKEIQNIIDQQKEKLIKEIRLVDVYQNPEPIQGKFKKTYTLTFYLQDEKKTLEEKILQQVMENLIQNFEVKCKAIIKRS